ncbi:MAG: tail fiber domain-containing protein, partial [Bryobacteraceae bacterium]
IGNANQTATFIAGISGADAIGGEAVFVNSFGKFGTVNLPSSARFKEDIKPMNKASEAILALTPVTFRYKKELDTQSTPQFGLIAEDVAKVDPNLVKRDRDGKRRKGQFRASGARRRGESLHRAV